MAKKLCAVLSGSTSEVAKNQVIAAVQGAVPGLSAGAANIRRDANGKVTEVIITVPDSASSAATTAINATPGVANVTTEDVPPGFDGFDGTEDNKTLLESQGWTFFASDASMTETFTATGELELEFLGLNPTDFWALGNVGGLPSHPLPYSSECRVKKENVGAGTVGANLDFSARTDNLNVRFIHNSDTQKLFLIVAHGPGTQVSSVAYDPGATFHTYTIDFDGTKVDAKVDGDIKLTRTISGTRATSNESIMNLTGKSLDGTTAPQITLDYFRATEVV